MLDALLDLLGVLVWGTFAAIAGVFYPPRSPAWAWRQKLAICCALAAIGLLTLAIVLGRDGWSPLVWFLFGWSLAQ